MNLSSALSILTKDERRQGRGLLGVVCVRGFADMLGVAMVFPFLTVLSNPELISTNGYLAWVYNLFGFANHDAFIVFLGLALIAVIILTTAFKLFTTYLITRWLDLRIHSLSSRLLEAYLRQPYEYFLGRHTSELITVMLSEVNRIVMEVLKPLADGLTAIVTLFFMAALLIVVDPMVTVLAVLVLGSLYGVMILAVRGISSRLGKRVLRANRKRFRLGWEALAGGKQIRLLNRERSVLESYLPASIVFAESTAKTRIVRQAPRYVVEAVVISGGIALCLILLARTGGIGSNAMGAVLPVLGVFMLAGYRMIPAFQNAYLAFVSLRIARAALETVREDLMGAEQLPALPDARIVPLQFENTIELRDVTYAYPGSDAPSLSGITLTIPAGSSVGIVGETGAGKSTLMDLLLGLILPTQGEMLIDGKPLDPTTVRRWRANVGYVPQDVFLSDATVAQNIAFGEPDNEIDLSRVKSAARMAQIEDFILSELPEGFQTSIGERGVRLSGGQRQRISIARALYTQPAVIAFDEATSALDNATEALVMQEISQLAGERTLIMVAHRLTTVRNCSKIVTLDGGRVMKVGSYEDLIRSEGVLVPSAMGGA